MPSGHRRHNIKLIQLGGSSGAGQGHGRGQPEGLEHAEGSLEHPGEHLAEHTIIEQQSLTLSGGDLIMTDLGNTNLYN